MAHDLYFGSGGAHCTIMGARGEFWNRVFNRALKCQDNLFGAVSVADAHRLSAANAGAQLFWTRDDVMRFGRAIASAQANAPVRAPSWLDEALDALDRGRPHAIRAIATLVRRDRAHFARSFTGYVGFAPAEYRALRRLGATLAALQGGSCNLADLALECGYAHQSHMNRDFRLVFGRQPSEFVKRQMQHSCKTHTDHRFYDD